MTALEQAIAEVVVALNELCSRVKLAHPKAFCQVGEMSATEPVQAYASFLADPAAESIDICIYFRQADETLEIFGDLVRGGSGEVLSEFSGETPTDTAGHGVTSWDIAAVRSYILSQEETVCEILRSAAPT